MLALVSLQSDRAVTAAARARAGPAALAALLRDAPPDAEPFPTDPDDVAPIPEAVADRLRERLDAAILCGLVELTADQYAGVLSAFMPDDHVPRLPTGPACDDAPQTAGRIATYGDRAGRLEPLARDTDAEAVRDDRAGVRFRRRLNGKGFQVVGFARAEPQPLPDGMYRLSSGAWIGIGCG